MLIEVLCIVVLLGNGFMYDGFMEFYLFIMNGVVIVGIGYLV